MNKKNPLSVCIALCLGLGAGSAAHAQPYSSIVAFGDSLTDSGALPDAETASIALGGAPADTLRITNRVGPTFMAPAPTGNIAIQYVAEDLGLGTINSVHDPIILPANSTGVPSPDDVRLGIASGNFPGTNYAVAGSRSDAILSSIVSAADPSVTPMDDPAGATLFNPRFNPAATSGLETRLILSQENGYLVDRPKADPNALYYVNGGANDLLGFFPSLATTAPNQQEALILQTASNAASNIVQGAAALADAGANYIMVANVPDLGRTALAEISAAQADALVGPGAGDRTKAGLTNLTTAFNMALSTGLRQLDANIIPFDLNGLLNEVSEDPNRFGFSSTTTCFSFDSNLAPCFEDPNVGLSTGAAANPDVLVFFDGIHPTVEAQRAIADYQVSILTAPAEISLLPIMGLVSVESDIRRASNALDVTRNIDTLGDLQINFTIDTTKNRFYNANYARGLEGDSMVFALDGIMKVSEHWKVGLSASVTSSEFDGRQSASNYETENIGLNLVAAYQKGRYQADVVINTTNLRYGTISRYAPVGGDTNRFEDGDTDGSATGVYLNAAYDISFDDDNWHYGPKLVLATIDVDVNGYTEYSNRVTALGFDDQEYGADFVQPSVFAQYLSDDKKWNFSATVGLRAELGQTNEDLGMRVKSQDFLDFVLPGYEQQDRESVIGEANFSYMPTQNARLSVQYRGQSDNNGYDSLSISGTYNF